jgi:hypothetical protein
LPRVDPTEYTSLPLEVARLVEGYPLHDVWLVELDGGRDCEIATLRALISADSRRSMPFSVRALFALRSALGNLFGLDLAPRDEPSGGLIDDVPADMAASSAIPPGTREGPFTLLYAARNERAYRARNRTVDAILVVALAPGGTGPRLFWATHLRPVGRVTAVYMGLIDPFRRLVVYPGLETWLKRRWSERTDQPVCTPTSGTPSPGDR